MQLQAAGLLEGERAAAAHSAPGDAFERVYGKVAGRVRARVEAADPVLAQWIQARRSPPASAVLLTCSCKSKGRGLGCSQNGYGGTGQVECASRQGCGLVARQCGRWAGACLLLPASRQTCLLFPMSCEVQRMLRSKQVHAYGAIYSAPGLTLLQKQFLTIAFLARPCLTTCAASLPTLLLPPLARMI